MWMEVLRSWMRTSRWKSSNCPLQEVPGLPSGAAFENKIMRLLGPNFHFHSSILGFSLSLPLPNYCPANHLEIPKIPLTLF